MGRPAHRATTANLSAIYPFMAGRGLGSEATYVGAESSGGSFCFDPWSLYPDVITNPNILVAGQLGRGKSALVKTLLWRGGKRRIWGGLRPRRGEFRILGWR